MKNQIPTSVKVISILLIALSALGGITIIFSMGQPGVELAYQQMGISMEFAIGQALVSYVVSIVCGIAMLKCLNWGRMLYIGLTVFGVISSIVMMGFGASILIGLAVQALIIFFLFRPIANDYFAEKNFPEEQIATSDNGDA